MFPLRDTIPSRHLPLMTLGLIGANLAAFAFQLSLDADQLQLLFERCGVVPARLLRPALHLSTVSPLGPGSSSGAGTPSWLPSALSRVDAWPLLTSTFLHGGWLHLITNMWTLWIFGDNVEDRTGPLRFLLFYLLCGALASSVHVATNSASMLPTIGASGAIAGVMGAYFLSYPRARIVTLIPIFFWPLLIELPAVLYLGVWFAMQLYSGGLQFAQRGAADSGGVAWWAHIGGFASGLLLLRLFVSAKRSAATDQDASRPNL